ncbi:hypothetical protein QEG73_22005 [Chitinophagaceae bacterium 26-R-25]|nr:hypothetical protein [Chitinophagaceae bacterium 26-R-25]
MERKTITLATNFNNKMACKAFVHIGLAPGPLKVSDLESTEIEIRTTDDSHPPVLAQLVDLCRLDLDKMPNAFTWQSHGMSSFDFFKWFTHQYQDVNGGTAMAVYFYKKI